MDATSRKDLSSELHFRLSHDIRSKVNIILGYCDMLSDETAPPGRETRQRYVSTLARTAQQLLLVDEEIRMLADNKAPGGQSLASRVARLSGQFPSMDIAIIGAVTPPPAINAMLDSVLSKFALAFPRGNVEIRNIAGGIEAAFDVTSSSGYDIDDFLRRFRARTNPQPKQDFDAFYLQTIGQQVNASIETNDGHLKILWQMP